ncbi:MAG: hypothetical protein ACD_3C00145G0005 [uncultured bacterium (gcode 4)]|uniref:Uncharacterized protein n=1 Tax=uncultured bacterium (gcode 4) TaxID=1234023 RepID=K2GC57_9BACT|nr:MAG: hypothetical protein ACD_3C00145G0005 [uncultured bacterium (gcode 4)]
MGKVRTIPVGWVHTEILVQRIIWRLEKEELSQELQDKIRTSVQESIQQVADESGFNIVWAGISN